MNNENSVPRWLQILSLIFGILGALVVAYQFFQQPKGKLSAYLVPNILSLPRYYEDSKQQQLDKLTSDYFASSFQKFKTEGKLSVSDNDLGYLAIGAARDAREAVRSVRMLEPLSGEKLYIAATINNDGDKALANVRLWIPGIAAYKIEKDGSKLVEVSDTPSVSIGNLDPLESISISIWASTGYFTGKKIRLTHSEGIGSVTWAEQIESNSIWLLLKQTWAPLIFTFAIFVFGISQAMSLYNSIRNRKAEPGKM